MFNNPKFCGLLSYIKLIDNPTCLVHILDYANGKSQAFRNMRINGMPKAHNPTSVGF